MVTWKRWGRLRAALQPFLSSVYGLTRLRKRSCQSCSAGIISPSTFIAAKQLPSVNSKTILVTFCNPECLLLLLLQVWSSEVLREQFLALPLPALHCLLASESTSVAAENTALVALAGWIEEGAVGSSATAAQRRELLSLVSVFFDFVGLVDFST